MLPKYNLLKSMAHQIFNLKPTDEFIPLMNLLQVLNIAQSGGHAKLMIEDGDVLVNGKVEFQKRKKLRKGDLVAIDDLNIVIG